MEFQTSESIKTIQTNAGRVEISSGKTLTITNGGTFGLAAEVVGGTVSVTGGTLNFASTQAANTSAVLVGSAATLKGTGTIGGSATISGVHAPGNSIGIQTIEGGVTYNADSVFEWEMNYAGSTRGTNYDAVNTASVSGSGAEFNIVLPGSTTFADTFWAQNRSWSDIFMNVAGDAVIANWAGVFSSLTFSNANGSITAPDAITQGSFTLSGNTLSWQAIPEPTTALAGLLLAAGLLRRRR